MRKILREPWEAANIISISFSHGERQWLLSGDNCIGQTNQPGKWPCMGCWLAMATTTTSSTITTPSTTTTSTMITSANCAYQTKTIASHNISWHTSNQPMKLPCHSHKISAEKLSIKRLPGFYLQAVFCVYCVCEPYRYQHVYALWTSIEHRVEMWKRRVDRARDMPPPPAYQLLLSFTPPFSYSLLSKSLVCPYVQHLLHSDRIEFEGQQVLTLH